MTEATRLLVEGAGIHYLLSRLFTAQHREQVASHRGVAFLVEFHDTLLLKTHRLSDLGSVGRLVSRVSMI